MKDSIKTRKEYAEQVLNDFLSGKALTQKGITRRCNLEDSGRIIDHIRWKLLVPIECDESVDPTRWQMTVQEIHRYKNQRDEQKAKQLAQLYDKRVEKATNWLIEIGRTEDGRQLVQAALSKIKGGI